jgi:hypothetical protein
MPELSLPRERIVERCVTYLAGLRTLTTIEEEAGFAAAGLEFWASDCNW